MAELVNLRRSGAANPGGMVGRLKYALTPVAMLIFSSIALVAISGPGPESEFVAAVFPPWWTAARSMAAASNAGEIVGISALPFIVVVAAGNTPDHSEVLNRAGVWFSVRSSSLLLCGKNFRKFGSA